MKGTNKKVFQLKLNEIHEVDDPTKVEAKFIILDFDVSHNKSLIQKEDAINSLSPTIINKPIVAKYIQNEDPNDGTDHFEGHNPHLDEKRDGELTIKMDTTPIGVFTSKGYIMETSTDNGVKEVLVADAILWKDRFEDAVDLLMEWHSNGVNINTSCEILYQNYEVKDGVEHIKSPIWMSGHAILNSEERGGYPVIKPAYDSSRLVSINELNKFNRLVAQAMSQNQKEDEKMEKENQTQEQEDQVENVDEKETEETLTEEKVEESEVETVDEEKEKVESTEDVETELDSVKKENKELHEKLNEATDKLVELSSLVEELKPIKEKYNQEQYEKSLNEKQEYYAAKFQALNADDKFKSEEVQKLVEQSVKEDIAVSQLNAMLVDLVAEKQVEGNEDKVFVQHNSQREDLIKTPEDFDSRYK